MTSDGTTSPSERSKGLSAEPEPAFSDVDALIDPHVEQAIAGLDGPAPLLGGMVRYHLGQLETDLGPVSDEVRRASRGKRLRPAVALLCCAAGGGEPARAAPVAAAIELLHNFTLIHDDIQDESETRRHRPTVWSIWGRGQAINAGDALFAAAHLALYGVRDAGVPADLALRLSDAFARTTIEIVQGQVLDLGFEGRGGVSPAAYLDMIARKTAAIVQYAAWAGALIGGADKRRAARFGEFGRALGLGFQVRDDLLGIWGAEATTGKPAADDIRRRKQSLPILFLRDRLAAAERDEVDQLYARPEIGPEDVSRVLELLDRHGVRASVEREVEALHREAKAALAVAASPDSAARSRLLTLVDSLAGRLR